MAEIKQLSPQDISKIAAGEVIERPASVLKELLENAVDAGARTVRVEFEGAGSGLLRVTDDGCGMSPRNLRAACRRHTTSKITAFSDLDSLATFGFRGEALFSIAAVSRLELSSCTHEPGAAGVRLELEGGRTVSESPAPPVPGTAVSVRDLFFNTPARLKFLKSPATERAHLLRVAEECALANPGVSFHVYAEKKRVYALAAGPVAAQGILARAREIMGSAADGFLHAGSPQDGITVFLSAPGGMVARRDLQFFFVNRRPVSAKTLSQALYKAYEGRRDNAKHPACVIFLELDPASFDVNVHPQKKEVRFRDESAVFSAVYQTAGKALLAALAEGTQQAAVREPEEPEGYFVKPPDRSGRPDRSGQAGPESGSAPKPPERELPGAPRETVSDNGFEPAFFEPYRKSGSANDIIKAASGADAQWDRTAADPAWWAPPYRFLGQLDRSYLLFECAAGLMIMDQHAAQERVLFEQYLAQFERGRLAVQRLMLAVNIEMPASAVENLMRWKDWLATAGFELERSGPKTVLAHSAPGIFELDDAGITAFIESAAEMLGDPVKCAEKVRRELVAMTACKRAVKAHDRLGESEALRLLRDLKRCENGLNCPHGRPTITVQPVAELARRFRRG
ncbi:MAG: DNA mismatch repair endonuclease MutL [Elusimicrobiaceae bacterium]|nr:DNA mismatch repair endonuclease MutL [Elusimicrobiaceae bacterium]